MKSFSYYFFEDENGTSGLNANSRECLDMPIMLNCAGSVELDHAFTTYNEKGREDYYLMYMTDGKLAVGVGKNTVSAKAGDFILFPPKYRYRYTSRGATVSYLYAHFTGSDVSKLLRALEISELPCVMSAGHCDAAAAAFSELFSAYLQNDRFRDLVAATALERVLIALSRARFAKEAPAPLARSVAHIKTFYTEEISVPDLAAMEGLSVSRYNAVFREKYKTSPIKYITNLRMMHACSMLSDTDLDIGKVAQTVGYEDNHFFSKMFKKYVGTSPSEYRRRVK